MDFADSLIRQVIGLHNSGPFESGDKVLLPVEKLRDLVFASAERERIACSELSKTFKWHEVDELRPEESNAAIAKLIAGRSNF